MIHVAAMQIGENLKPSELESARAQLRLSVASQKIPKTQSLLGRLLACALIRRYANGSGEDIVFSKDCNGKPVQKTFADIHFSVSHTSGWVACALSRQPVGLDIEQLDGRNYDPLLRLFRGDEAAYVGHRGKLSRLRLLNIWTIKESFLKLSGRGLRESLSAFSVFRASAHFFPIYLSDGCFGHVCSLAVHDVIVSRLHLPELPQFAGL
jgi:4'-phosphopantetheinyl transferase